MARNNQDWEDLGRSVQDIVDQAIHSQNYQQLNQTIRQVVGRAVDMGSEAVRKAMDGASRSVPNADAPPVPQTKDLDLLYGSTSGKYAAGVLKIVGGGILSFFTLMSLVAVSALHWMFLDVGLIPAALALCGFGAGGGLIYSGVSTLGWVNRFKTYRKTLGQKTHCTLERLARSVGKSVKYVRREVRKMIDQGLFLEGHINKEGTCLITSDETFRYFEQSRLQLEQRQRQMAAEQAKKAKSSHSPQVQEVLDRGNAFITQIRRCNDAIPGEEISRKISRMETIVRRIFQRVEEHPEIVPDLKKMMDYYLPMTVKLLNAYADMDAQPVQGETIQASKREIEGTLDTLNLAFEKLLDDLFQDTAMDVSSDISVLNTLLAQEGLTGDELTNIRKQKQG